MMKKKRWVISIAVVVGVLGVLPLWTEGRNSGTASRRSNGLQAAPAVGFTTTNAVGSESAKLIWTPVMTGGFGNPDNFLLRGLEVFDGQLYALVANGKEGGAVYRSATGEPGSWERVVEKGFSPFGNNLAVDFRSMRVWNGQLFVGTGLPRGKQGAQIWRSLDGMLWQQVVDDGFGQGRQHLSIRAMASFGSYFYIGTGTEFIGSAAIYRTPTGSAWEQVMGDGFGKALNNHVYSLEVFRGQLYAGTFNLNGAEVYRSSDGISWEKVADGGLGDPRNIYVYELRTYQPTPTSAAKLIAITGPNLTGGQVLAYDGTKWSLFAPKGTWKAQNTDIWQANQFGGDFYVGTFKLARKHGKDQGAELWRYDYSTGKWVAETADGFGNPDNDGVRTIFSWQGALYVGTRNRKTGCELWKGTPR